MANLAPIFNLGRISKALAGGRSSAVVAAGTGVFSTWAVSQFVPDRLIDQVPWWVYIFLGIGPGIIGYIVSFIDVYLAKANTDPLTVIPIPEDRPPPNVIVVQPGEPVSAPKPGEVVAMVPIPTEAVVVTKPKSGAVAATMTDPAAPASKEK